MCVHVYRHGRISHPFRRTCKPRQCTAPSLLQVPAESLRLPAPYSHPRTIATTHTHGHQTDSSSVIALTLFPPWSRSTGPGYCEGRGSKFFEYNTRFFCIGRLNGCLGPNYVPGTFCLDVPSARGSPSPTGSLTLRRDDGRDGVTGVARPLRTSNRRSCVVR